MAENRFYSLWLSFICIVVFVLQLVFNGFTDLFVLNSRALHNLEIWRFLTAIFLHGSLTHLLFNLFALAVFGLVLESKVGSWKFLAVFFSSGITANVISVNFYESSLGASGAIMGVLGCLTILDPFMMVWTFGILMPLFIAAVLWVIGDVLGIFMPSGIGNIAHLSGIAVGFFIGIFLRIFKRKRVENKNELRFNERHIMDWEDENVRGR